jgi:hypothetical protein
MLDVTLSAVFAMLLCSSLGIRFPSILCKGGDHAIPCFLFFFNFYFIVFIFIHMSLFSNDLETEGDTQQYKESGRG